MPIKKEEGGSKKLLFTIVIGFVLVTSIIGFTFSAIPYSDPTQGSLKYGDIELVQTNTGYATVLNNQIFEFTYHPSDLETYNVSALESKLSNVKAIYATSDLNSPLASQISGTEFDLSRILDAEKNVYLDVGFTGSNSFNKSVINCADATPFVPVIYFNFTNTSTELNDAGNCVIVNFASENSLAKIKDTVVYRLIGVLE